MKYFVILFLSFFILNCKEEKVAKPSASSIIDQSISFSGGQRVASSTIAFKFRDKHYKAIRDGGNFEFMRFFKDSVFQVRDVLNNSGFKRFKNGYETKVADSMVPVYSASVNSVHYFSVLPYGLNDQAVNKEYISKVKIKGKDYHKIKVTFDQDGGGEDYEDVFIYWIHSEAHTVDYLAYSYNETDDLGFRFREAYNPRQIEGIRFVDYNNYKPKATVVTVEDLDRLFELNELELLSKIELENITVSVSTN